MGGDGHSGRRSRSPLPGRCSSLNGSEQSFRVDGQGNAGVDPVEFEERVVAVPPDACLSNRVRFEVDLDQDERRLSTSEANGEAEVRVGSACASDGGDGREEAAQRLWVRRQGSCQVAQRVSDTPPPL